MPPNSTAQERAPLLFCPCDRGAAVLETTLRLRAQLLFRENWFAEHIQHNEEARVRCALLCDKNQQRESFIDNDSILAVLPSLLALQFGESAH